MLFYSSSFWKSASGVQRIAHKARAIKLQQGIQAMAFTSWVENPQAIPGSRVVLCVPEHDVEKDYPIIRS